MVVERNRLFRQLDRAREDPVVWIAAPPGEGKTTLVASYLRARPLKALWYQVDEGDADLATFFHYLGLGIQKAAPRYRHPLPHFTPEYLPGLPIFAQRFFEQLFFRLKSPSILVLDNYQEVPEDAQMHAVLKMAVKVMPPGCAILVLSRQEPPPLLVRGEAAPRMTKVEEESLRLTVGETKAIIRLHTGRSKGRLPTRPCGGVTEENAGVGRGADSVPGTRAREEPKAPQEEAPTPKVIFDYLATEVLARLDRERREFLLKTAFLPSMTPLMATKLTGHTNAGRLLRWLYRTRYFTERRAEGEMVYQYHPLFREFLVDQAKERWETRVVKTIQAQAARLLEEDGRVEEAVPLFQVSGQWQEVVRLICGHAPQLLAQGRIDTVESWIKLLSQQMVEETPWVLFWLANCKFATNPSEAQEVFERAFTLFEKHQDHSGSLMAWCGVVESTIWGWSNLRQLEPWIARLAIPGPKGTTYPSPEIKSRVVSSMFMGLWWGRPEDPKMSDWAEPVWELIKSSKDSDLAMRMGEQLTHYYTMCGDLQNMAKVVEILKTRLQNEPVSPLGEIFFLLAQSLSTWQLGQPEGSLKAVTEALRISRKSGVRVLEGILHSMKFYYLMFVGKISDAEFLLRERGNYMDVSPTLASFTFHFQKRFTRPTAGKKWAGF